MPVSFSRTRKHQMLAFEASVYFKYPLCMLADCSLCCSGIFIILLITVVLLLLDSGGILMKIGTWDVTVV